MTFKSNIMASGTLVLLLGMLFGVQSVRGETAPDCNASDRPVAVPLVWPRAQQKTALTPSCWVSAAQVDAWQQSHNVVWVDVRSRLKKQAYPLEGSLDIALISLQDQTFLRDKRIVMVGDGFDQPELDRACRELREAGFQRVYALQDGVKTRSTQRADNIDVITPAELLAGSRATSWKIIAWDLSAADIATLPEKPAEQWFSAEGNLSLLSQRIGELSQPKRGQTAPTKIVIVTAEDKTNRQLRSLLQQHSPISNLLWLQGGVQAYQHYIQRQHDIRINTGLSLQRSCFGAASYKNN